jgi:hypothetical protein
VGCFAHIPSEDKTPLITITKNSFAKLAVGLRNARENACCASLSRRYLHTPFLSPSFLGNSNAELVKDRLLVNVRLSAGEFKLQAAVLLGKKRSSPISPLPPNQKTKAIC